MPLGQAITSNVSTRDANCSVFYKEIDQLLLVVLMWLLYFACEEASASANWLRSLNLSFST